jgi:SAM-dependent methyltransferase
LAGRRLRTYRKKLERLGVLGGSADLKTLDIACGSGEALDIMSTSGAKGLYGLDLFRPEQASHHFSRIAANGTRLPFASATFDRVICTHSLHHFRTKMNLQLLFEESSRVLKSSGRLFLIDHFDTFYLRLIFWLCQLRNPLYPASVKCFGTQLREEQDCIGWWLSNWSDIFVLVKDSGILIERFERGLFFFYLQGVKD